MTGQPEVTASGAGSAAVGRDNLGIIATGPDARIHVSYAGRPEPEWPHRVGVVPQLAPGYLPRTAPAVEIDRLFHRVAGTAVLTGVVAGMGGVGKTQLAAAFAHRVWDAGGVDLLVWLSATSRDAIVTGFARAGADVAHPPVGEDTEQVAARFLAWLAVTDKRWLLVLDDVTDPADLRGLWPSGRTGRVLVTTRRRDAALADRGTVIGVDVFTPQEAVACLSGRLDVDGEHPERLVEAGELVAELGRLPLALAQAAGYILDQQPLTCAGYRRLLAAQRLEMALPATAGDDYAAPVAAIWGLSVALASRTSPAGLAGPLLMLAAVLDPHGIPSDVFTTGAARAYLATARTATGVAVPWGEHQVPRHGTGAGAALRRRGLLHRLRLGQLAVSRRVAAWTGRARLVAAEEAEAGLRTLHRLSLITRVDSDTAAGLVRIHGLVQRATREQADPPALNAAVQAAAEALVAAWPEEDYQPARTLLAQRLRDNVDALVRTAPGPLWTQDAHPVLSRAAQSRVQ